MDNEEIKKQAHEEYIKYAILQFVLQLALKSVKSKEDLEKEIKVFKNNQKQLMNYALKQASFADATNSINGDEEETRMILNSRLKDLHFFFLAQYEKLKTS